MYKIYGNVINVLQCQVERKAKNEFLVGNKSRNQLAEDTNNFVELSDHFILNFQILVFEKNFLYSKIK